MYLGIFSWGSGWVFGLTEIPKGGGDNLTWVVIKL